MIYEITDFGAEAGCEKLQTEAIQAAADQCRDSGGGTINIPPGLFRIGTVRLYSNTVLYLEPGAVLRGPDSIKGYSQIPFAWELYPFTYSLIYAMDAENISIKGKGTIDFNGRAFVLWDNLCTGLAEDKTGLLTGAQKKDCHYAMPPRKERPNRLMFFHNCNNIELSGISLKDSPTWGAVFSSCNFVRVCNINIDNHMQVPNSDGIHCCGCRDVLISGCFISSGDDCIAITGIADFECVSERIIITECVLRSASSAIRIGFKASKIRNVMLQNLLINDSNRGIAIFAGEGGWVEDISIADLSIETRIYAGTWWGNGEPLVICGMLPGTKIKTISVRNIKARSENSIIVTGVQHLVLKDWFVTLRYGNTRPLYGDNIDLSPQPPQQAPDAKKMIPWLSAVNIEELITKNITVQRATNEHYAFNIAPVIIKGIK